MKRAFISYSLADKDRYIVSILTSELRKSGLLVLTTSNFSSTSPNFTTKKNIDSADLFIGVVTDRSNVVERVLSEWNYANERSIPNIFVVEDTVDTDPNYHDNLVKFDRHDVGSAIQYVKQRIQMSKVPNQNKQEWVPWVLGGSAVLNVVSLLEND